MRDALICLILLCSAQGCNRNAGVRNITPLAASPRRADLSVIYNAYLGCDCANFDDNDTTVSGGPGINGESYLYINGEPVAGFSHGITMIALTAFLRPGENTLTVKGQFSGSVFLKVGRSCDGAVTLVGKHRFEENSPEYILTLNADVPDFWPPMDILSRDEASRIVYRKEVEETIDHLKDLCRQHRGHELTAFLYAGGPQQSFKMSGIKCFDLQSLDAFADAISQPAVKVINSSEKLDVIFGKYTVFVATDVGWQTTLQGYVFQMSDNTQKYEIKPLSLYRENGKWHCWRY